MTPKQMIDQAIRNAVITTAVSTYNLVIEQCQQCLDSGIVTDEIGIKAVMTWCEVMKLEVGML